MTKRYGNGQATAANSKKPKLDDEEFWDDDLDDEALDKCFELASQVFEGQIAASHTKDVSIVPSYTAFKNPSAFASSTQLNTISNASTSKTLSLNELECELRKLKQQNEEKDGEISILRSRIKESSSCIQIEQQKTTNEWREKLRIAQREVKSIKADLEFKNLEIGNLKQQLSEVKRINLDSTFNNTQQHAVPQPVVKVNHERVSLSKKENEDKSSHKEAIVEQVYPLKSISPDSFKSKIVENHVIKNSSYKICRNATPYLQNQQTYCEETFNHKCPRLGNKKITFENVYPDIIKLANSTLEEINNISCVEAINRIICTALILLKDLNDYLVEFCSRLRTEDVQQSDVKYLLNDVKSNLNDGSQQLGVEASKILDVTSRLISCSSYAADFVCSNNTLKLLPQSIEYTKLIPHRNGVIQNDFYFIRLLITIVNNIGKYRMAGQTNGFLVSTARLLEGIAILNNKSYMLNLTEGNELFCKLFKEIVFARPGTEVVKRITFILKMCSQYKYFIRYLFKKNGNNELLKAGPKGILYFNEEVCPFCVLAILLQNYALRTEKLPLEVCYNMLCFIYHSFKTSHWIHHEGGDSVCVCLSQLYKLEIDFVFRGIADFVKCYEKKPKQLSEEWSRFLNHEIIQKVLNQMNFNNFELTEKYVTVFAQYKEIENFLKNTGLFNVAQLNTSEELLNVSHESFNKDF